MFGSPLYTLQVTVRYASLYDVSPPSNCSLTFNIYENRAFDDSPQSPLSLCHSCMGGSPYLELGLPQSRRFDGVKRVVLPLVRGQSVANDSLYTAPYALMALVGLVSVPSIRSPSRSLPSRALC